MAKGNKTNEKTALVMAKTLNFIKHNIYYILMGICILALASVITIAAVVNSNKKATNEIQNPITPGPQEQIDNNNEIDDNNKEKENDAQLNNPVVVEQFYVSAPVDDYTIGQAFDNTALVYSSTHNHWATHEGVDFKVKEGSIVKCVYDGVVKSVETNSYYGAIVVIEHKDGYESVYKLLDQVTLKVGDKIKRNEKIGIVSKDALAEINDGVHLHFELLKDGQRINPLEFLTEGNK